MFQSKKKTIPSVPMEQCSVVAIKPNQVVGYECRICFECFSIEKNSMLQPCACTGSVKYVHEQCLKQWITKVIGQRKEKLIAGKAHMLCELCTTKIHFNTETSVTCKHPQAIKQTMKMKPKALAVMLLILLICMGFFGVLLDYLMRVGWTILNGTNAFLVILMITAEVVIALVSFTIMGLILKDYFLQRNICISEIQTKKQKNYKQTKKVQIQS